MAIAEAIREIFPEVIILNCDFILIFPHRNDLPIICVICVLRRHVLRLHRD
jgi:hypothetical protein